MEGGDGKAEESDFMFVEGQWWSQKGVCMCVCVCSRGWEAVFACSSFLHCNCNSFLVCCIPDLNEDTPQLHKITLEMKVK